MLRFYLFTSLRLSLFLNGFSFQSLFQDFRFNIIVRKIGIFFYRMVIKYEPQFLSVLL